MLGNRFHDAGTPPPIMVPGLGQLGGNSPEDTPTTLSEIDEDVEQTIPNLKKVTSHLPDDDALSVKAPARRPSHTDHAIEIVESITQPVTHGARRPSAAHRHPPHRRGVLANLLKLDVTENRPSRPNALRRPVHHLRSFYSSKSIKLGQQKHKDIRNSLNLEDYDIEKKTSPMTYPDMAAQRMQITAEIADLLERQDLIIKLGKALVRTGAPSYRIEAALEKTSKRLEVNGSYFVLPGLIMVSFGDEETHTSETHLIKCAKSLDLAKLETVNDIARKVYKGHLDVVEANDLLDNIKNSPPTWGFGMTLVGYVLSSAFIAPLFFNGSWTDCWVSGIFGLCVGIATFISERVPMLNNVFEMAITIVVSVIVLALSPNVCYLAVSLSAVVVALPGYSLTSAVMELAAKNLCSGTVHLAHALMYVLFLAFGMSYGSGIWHLSHGDDMTSGANNVSPLQTCMNSVDPYWFFLILPLTCLGILICYGGSLRQYPGFTLNSAVGFVLYFFLNKRLGTSTSASNITSSVCAFAIGVVSNIYARITKNTTNHIHFAIVILVPGSLGVRGAFNLFDGNSSNGSDFVIQIIGIALSITLGLFLANVCVYPNGRKRSVFLGF